MTTALEAVAQVNALSAVSGLERFSYLFRSADSLFSIPSTIQAWGNVTAAPGNATIRTITPMTIAADGIASVAGQTPSPFASEFLSDAFARATSKIATNPAYAQTAASLYLNAAIYRSQHGSDVTPLNTTRSIQPVTGVRAITPV